MLRQCRNESILDHEIPVGLPAVFGKVEIGRTIAEYFKWKHGDSGPGPGKYYGLHMTAPSFFKK